MIFCEILKEAYWSDYAVVLHIRFACKLHKFACVSSTETSVEPSLQAKQLKLKRARLADDLNDKISHRPGPIELIHKNILPVPTLLGQH